MPPDPLAERVVAALVDRGETLATAESLTGGLIGAAITSVPGASAVYRGGLVTYATPLKERLGGVPADVLAVHGVISQETAVAMADGVRAATGSDWAIGITGVAGPDPQEGHRPGEVWVGLAGPGFPTAAAVLDLAGDRESIRLQSVAGALGWLASYLRVRSI